MACTAQGNRVYSGKVSGEKIETEKLKLSFLLGAYLCYGKACDNEIGKYRFFMTNAQNKSKLIAVSAKRRKHVLNIIPLTGKRQISSINGQKF